MDAEHITAWSCGGATDIVNCQMLCQTHNRAKGNRPTTIFNGGTHECVAANESKADH